MKKIISLLITMLVIFSNLVTAVEAHNDMYYTDDNYYTTSGYAYTQYYGNQRTSNKRKVKRTNTRQPQIIYVYQTVPTSGYTYTQYNPGYPGCGRADIIIGGQIWAACNVAGGSNGATGVSGWFFANDLRASFVSANGQNTRLEWQGKVIPVANW